MADLIIADAEYSESAEKYYTFATKMDGYVNEYIKIMSEIVSEKCLEGFVAEKLEEFNALIEASLSGQLTSVMAMQKNKWLIIYPVLMMLTSICIK